MKKLILNTLYILLAVVLLTSCGSDINSRHLDGTILTDNQTGRVYKLELADNNKFWLKEKYTKISGGDTVAIYEYTK